MRAKLVEDFKVLTGPSDEEAGAALDKIKEESQKEWDRQIIHDKKVNPSTFYDYVDPDIYYECVDNKGDIVRIVYMLDSTQNRIRMDQFVGLGWKAERQWWSKREWDLQGIDLDYFEEYKYDISEEDAKAAKKYLEENQKK